MQVVNQLLPSPDQAAAFFAGPDAGPFVMINLLKFRERADYGDDPEGLGGVSGREAYARYGIAVRAFVEGVGGRIGYAGPVTGLLLGEVEELWDMVALAEYPGLAAMQAMIADPGYQAIARHRAAGLAGQLNIRTAGRLP